MTQIATSKSSYVEPTTIVELLRSRAVEQPQDRAYTFMVDGKKEGDSFTYAQLDRQTKAIAATLQKHNAEGERALLLYPQGLEVIAAFCGCLYAGTIAIPVPPPESGRLKRTLPRLRSIVRDASATIALTTAGILELIATVKDEFPEFEQMRWLDTAQVDINLADE